MIDIFVIVVVFAAFRVSVLSPQVAFLPENFYSVDLLIVPMWGLYSNMTAQLVSQVSSHFIIYYHRRIVSKGTEKLSRSAAGEEEAKHQTEESEGKILLGTHSFSSHLGESTEALVPRTWVAILLMVASSFMVALVAIGSFVPSFSVEILGIIGVAVESGQEFEEAITEHSVWSIVGMLFDLARFLDTTNSYIGIGVLGSLFLATVLVVPILQALFLMCQWIVPLRKTTRIRLSVLNEILQAWQYIEVYLIALFVASWQLGPVSQYLFNAYCGSLDGFFAQMVSYGILKEVDAQCFSVQGSIDPGSIALLLAAILLAFVNSIVTLASKQCLVDYDASQKSQTNQIVSKPNDDSAESSEQGSDGAESTKVRPPPFVFTDIHRWLLTSIEVKNDNGNA